MLSLSLDPNLPTPAPAEPGACSEYGLEYIEFNGDCFKAVPEEQATWEAAEEYCA